MVEESRRAELQSLGLASDAARLSLERYQAQGEGSVAALAAARSQLLHMMQVCDGPCISRLGLLPCLART